MQLQGYTTRICGLFCALIWLLAGCEAEGDPATAVAISVQSDLVDLAKIEVAVFESDANPSKDAPDDDKRQTVAAALDDLPVSIAVVRGHSDEVTISVRGLDKLKNVLAEARVTVGFLPGKTLRLPIFLGEVCRDQACRSSSRLTCYFEPLQKTEAGECGPIPIVRGKDLEEITDPSTVNDWDAAGLIAEMDTGVDAGPDGSDADPGQRSVDASPDGNVLDATPAIDAPMCVKPTLASAECGLAPQCGCSGTKSACRLEFSNTMPVTVCKEPGTAMPNAACKIPDECPAGYDCIGEDGRCTPYCTKDSECGEGGVCLNIVDTKGNPISGSGGCFVACNPTTGSPCGPGVACAKVSNRTFMGKTINGNFCLTPAKNCLSKNNGVCDEPNGTRLCAEGTDTADCCHVAFPSGGACDLMTSCGCSGATPACNVTSETNGTPAVSCRAAGTVPREGVCKATSDCGPGADCIGNICRKYCNTIADCGSGTAECSPIIIGGKATTTAKVCLSSCDPSVASSCAMGATCSNVPDEADHVCSAVACSGKLLTNNRCDEPSGTGLCLKGTDVDCGPTMCVAPLPPAQPQGTCDLVTQCGCAATQACIMTALGLDGVATAGCAMPTTVAAGGACTAAMPLAACGKGFDCIGGKCLRYCRADTECGGVGTCKPIKVSETGVAIPGVKACF